MYIGEMESMESMGLSLASILGMHPSTIDHLSNKGIYFGKLLGGILLK
jgi:hypothetical protein